MAVAEAIEEVAGTAVPVEVKSAPMSAAAVMPPGPDLDVCVAERAYFLWEASGWIPGHDLEFWLTAENELFGSGDGPTA